ncbi:thiol-disulfide oxidoreductase DCC family protein [Marinobacter sp. C2H3]|uniref:thiol-disulfide oxidoreductase DCC family protein n=1 Tax=Marinobacter sp. C2H3 TaxID=3119003 RepID=UPI00300E9744
MNPQFDTLFYDGRCPLCAREIRTLRKLQDGNLLFADVHQQNPTSETLPSREELLLRLHLMTPTGDWVTGLNATVRAWSHTAVGWLFKPLLWPGIYPIANRAYERWADRRFARKYACATGTACASGDSREA